VWEKDTAGEIEACVYKKPHQKQDGIIKSYTSSKKNPKVKQEMVWEAKIRSFSQIATNSGEVTTHIPFAGEKEKAKLAGQIGI